MSSTDITTTNLKVNFWKDRAQMVANYPLADSELHALSTRETQPALALTNVGGAIEMDLSQAYVGTYSPTAGDTGVFSVSNTVAAGLYMSFELWLNNGNNFANLSLSFPAPRFVWIDGVPTLAAGQTILRFESTDGGTTWYISKQTASSGGGTPYVLPAATATVRGGVTIGDNIAIAGDKISVPEIDNINAELDVLDARTSPLVSFAYYLKTGGIMDNVRPTLPGGNVIAVAGGLTTTEKTCYTFSYTLTGDGIARASSTYNIVMPYENLQASNRDYIMRYQLTVGATTIYNVTRPAFRPSLTNYIEEFQQPSQLTADTPFTTGQVVTFTVFGRVQTNTSGMDLRVNSSNTMARMVRNEQTSSINATNVYTTYNNTVVTQETFNNLVSSPTVVTVSPIAGNLTLNLALGTVFVYNMLALGAVLVIQNPFPSPKFNSFIMHVTPVAGGSLVYPAGTRFAGGTQPVFSASGVDILAFQSTNGGTNWIVTKIAGGIA